MKPLVAYRYLTDTDTAAFCHKVTEALSRGWALYGHPAYAFDAAGRGHALRPGGGEGCRGRVPTRT